MVRLADAQLWVEAAAPALGWKEGAFTHALLTNRSEATGVVVDVSPVGVALRGLEAPFEGTASELLELLDPDGNWVHMKACPGTPKALSGAVKRLAPALREEGFEVDTDARVGVNRAKGFEIVPPAAAERATEGRVARAEPSL